jgi:hypothetical protein
MKTVGAASDESPGHEVEKEEKDICNSNVT